MAYNSNDRFAWIRDNLAQHEAKGLIRHKAPNKCLKNQKCHSPTLGVSVTEKVTAKGVTIKTIRSMATA